MIVTNTEDDSEQAFSKNPQQKLSKPDSMKKFVEIL